MAAVCAPFRFPRAAVIAVAVLGLPAAAHLMAGGHLPPPTIVAALSSVVLLSAVLLAGIRMTGPVLVAYLAAGQTTLHHAFSVFSGDSTLLFENGTHHGVVLDPVARPAVDAIPTEHLAAADSPLMLVLHAAATVLAAIVLAWGEAALWALARWLRPLAVVSEAFGVAPTSSTLTAKYGTLARRWRYLGKPSTRGPPRTEAHLPA